jgi:hypothetical protein
MSTVPQQQSRILYISDTEKNTVVPDLKLPVSSGVNNWDSFNNTNTSDDGLNGFFQQLFGCNFTWNDPSTWLCVIFFLVGTILAVMISWKTNVQSETVLRVIFAGTAGFFNYLYIILHYLFQTTK